MKANKARPVAEDLAKKMKRRKFYGTTKFCNRS